MDWCYFPSTGKTITSRHVEETDAGLDRPLYLRNKNLKILNHKITTLIYCGFRVVVCALWLYNTSWLDQNFRSKRFLKQLTVSAETTWFERLFHIGIARLVELNFLKS